MCKLCEEFTQHYASWRRGWRSGVLTGHQSTWASRIAAFWCHYITTSQLPGSEAQGDDTKEVAATPVEWNRSCLLLPPLTMRTDVHGLLDMAVQELNLQHAAARRSRWSKCVPMLAQRTPDLYCVRLKKYQSRSSSFTNSSGYGHPNIILARTV